MGRIRGKEGHDWNWVGYGDGVTQSSLVGHAGWTADCNPRGFYETKTHDKSLYENVPWLNHPDGIADKILEIMNGDVYFGSEVESGDKILLAYAIARQLQSLKKVQDSIRQRE